MNRNYKMDLAGTAALMRSAQVANHLATVAEDAQRFAESISPDAPEIGEGYVASFHTERDEETVARTRRAVARLVNDAPHAAAVEDRTHVLSRTKDYIEQRYG